MQVLSYHTGRCYNCGKEFSRLEEGILFYCPACEEEGSRLAETKLRRGYRMTVGELKKRLGEFDDAIEVSVDGTGLKFMSLEVDSQGQVYLELS